MKKYILIFFLSFTLVFGQKGEFKEQDLGNPEFQNEILFFKSADTLLTRVDVFFNISYDNLRFVKILGEQIAKYEASVTILDINENVVLEKSWIEEIKYQTNSEDKLFSVTQKSFDLKPIKYIFKLKIKDIESGKISSKNINVEVQKFSKSNIEISSCLYLNKFRSENNKIVLTPNLSSNLNEMEDGFAFYFEVYNRDCNDSLKIHYKIKGKNDSLIYENYETKFCQSKIKILTNLNKINLSTGEYKFEISIINKTDSVKKVKQLISRRGSSSIFIKDYDLAIRQLKYIAKNSEYDILTESKISDDEKQKRFNEFWKKRDPNPETDVNEYFEEYYFRVEYANSHFSHYNDGWKTDMGMVFIIFGMPNNVERHPLEINTKPYEVWTYYEYNRQLVFVDETGFGDYRLVTPIWDLMNRLK